MITTKPVIDTSFDTRTDAGKGDPDTTSARLREYHRLLWSKELPDGTLFSLDTSNPRRYLFHTSARGEFFLASDTVVPTYRSWQRMRHLIDAIRPEELDEFQYLNHTIGGAMVFPGERRKGTMTLNGARGFNAHIADRFDLTLDCIRRQYAREANPLARVLENYWDFFALFDDFDGYVDFFLLQDLVDDGNVRFHLPPTRDGSALPGDVTAYLEYRDNAQMFLRARNSRIAEWAAARFAS